MDSGSGRIRYFIIVIYDRLPVSRPIIALSCGYAIANPTIFTMTLNVSAGRRTTFCREEPFGISHDVVTGTRRPNAKRFSRLCGSLEKFRVRENNGDFNARSS